MLEAGKFMDIEISTKAFATNMSLEAAINALSGYEDRYNRHFPTAVNFTLIGVQSIEDVSNGALQCMRVELIETLPSQFE